MSFQVCHDTTEAIEFCERYNMYLKPMWKIKISVQLPALKTPGQGISSWEVMEKLRNLIKPDEFTTLKVSKTNLILIQFECEVEKKATSKRVLQKLQSNTMKLSGFSEVLKIRAAPAKLNYPSRHDWDSFFRDAKNIDEMKPGERPDTVYIENLPTKWFSEDSSDNPSEYVLRKVFETFGDIRQVCIPSKHNSAPTDTFGKISAFTRDLVFDAYIQYKEYISFVKAMDSLKGMKLLYKSDSSKAHCADIKVDFDKTKYLSDKSIQHRAAEQEKVKKSSTTHRTPKKQTAPRPAKIYESKKSEGSSSSHKKNEKKHFKLKKSVLSKAKLKREKEAQHFVKALVHFAEMKELDRKVKEKEKQIEEERLLQQKLAERALDEERKQKEEAERQKRIYLLEQEKVLRQKLLKSLKNKEHQRTEALREKLRKEIAGKKILKSVLVVSHNRHNFKKLKSDKHRR